MAIEEISPLAAYLFSFLDISLPAWLMIFVAIVCYWFLYLVPALAMLHFFDRKVGADIQMRIGPNRVGPNGLFQGLADKVKYFFKEDVRPRVQGRIMFVWGPFLAIASVFIALANIPISGHWVLANLNSGLFFVVIALPLSRMFLFWAAYSIESPWSVLSAFRLLTVMATYLVPVSLAVVPPILISGSMHLGEIYAAQQGSPLRWNIFHDPGALMGGIILFFSLHIWLGRDPWDFAGSPDEIQGGFKAEYSGFHRELLQILEYMSFLLTCSLMVSLYLGGGNVPLDLSSFGRASDAVEALVFLSKTALLAFFSIWIRWSLPRFRIDQLVSLAWRGLTPASLAGIFLTAFWLAMQGPS